MWRRARALLRGIGTALQDAWISYRRHRGSLLGAALAFYTLLSIAPLLVVAVAIAGVVFGEGAARAQAMRAVDELLGERGAAAVGPWMDAARDASEEATLVGVVLFFYGASRVFLQLESALDAVWDAPVPDIDSVPTVMRSLIGERIVSFALMMGFGVVIAGSLVAQMAIDVVTATLFPPGDIAHLVLRVAQLALFLSVLTLGFAIAFRRAPHRHVELHETWLGALVTALLFMIGNALLGLYFAHVDVGAAYGAAGSVVAILVWLVYSGQIVMFGAELTRVVALRGGRVRASEGGHAPRALREEAWGA